LFHGSIRDNILLGLDLEENRIEDSEIFEICEKAMIKDVVLSLPDGLDTHLSGGTLTQLSGGQKQRIAIARALIRKPQLLILDEATSALDYLSEREVQKTLDKICSESNLTVVVVAHRLSTVRNSDRIYVLENGIVQESGSHDDLMTKKGKYFKLCGRDEIKDDGNSDGEIQEYDVAIDSGNITMESNTKFKIFSFLRHQIVMTPAFLNDPVFQYIYSITIAYCTQSMCYNYHC
jgi:ABC-type methionine transport system ATPase subunit